MVLTVLIKVKNNDSFHHKIAFYGIRNYFLSQTIIRLCFSKQLQMGDFLYFFFFQDVVFFLYFFLAHLS